MQSSKQIKEKVETSFHTCQIIFAIIPNSNAYQLASLGSYWTC